jgi:hypothetical protein
MKKLILTIIILSIISLAFQSSPYARRIYPLSSTPGSCQENEIMYNMTSHSLFICTNSGYVALATGASGSFAPADASYITKTTNPTLTGEFALGTLSTGILKVTTTTGDLSIAAAGTDYESPLTFNSPLSRSVNTISCATCALTSGNLSQFASTTSAQLAGVLSDESGSGVFLNATLASLTSNDVLTWNGSNWINQAASGGGSIGSSNINMTVANASSVGTTIGLLAKLTGAPSTVRNTETTDTENSIGVCTSGCGTTGNATIAIAGQVTCQFDGSTTAGNYVVISVTSAGKCHDAGSSFPTDKAAYGRVLTTNVGAGTYAMTLMTPDIAFQNAGNGKSKPGGSNTDIQWNNSGVFAGGGLRYTGTNFGPPASGVTLGNVNSNEFDNIRVAFAGGFVFRGGGQLKNSQAGSPSDKTLMFANTTGGAGTWATVDAREFNAVNGITNDPDFGAEAFWYRITPSNASGGSTLSGGRDIAQDTEMHMITNIGTSGNQDLILLNQNTGSSAARRWLTNTGLDIHLSGDESAPYIYDGATQRLRIGKYENSDIVNAIAQFDKTDTTLANVTFDHAFNVSATRTYQINAKIYFDADVTGGSKWAIGGTATAAAVVYQINVICNATNLFVINSRQTALAGSVGQAGCTAGYTEINGTITVNAAGTLTLQFAQNAASGTSSILVGSTMELTKIR